MGLSLSVSYTTVNIPKQGLEPTLWKEDSAREGTGHACKSCAKSEWLAATHTLAYCDTQLTIPVNIYSKEPLLNFFMETEVLN